MNTTSKPEIAAVAAGQTYNPPAMPQVSSTALMLDAGSMDKLIRLAQFMSSGRSTIPKHLQGNEGDCLAVAMQATLWNMSPFTVAQKTHLINGVLGYESQLVAAAINTSGIVADRFNFEWFGDWHKIVGKFKEVTSTKKLDDNGQPKKYIVPAWDQKDEHGLGVRVWATIRGEKEPRVLELLMTQARTRNSTLWTEDPKQQLAYLAQKRWARLYAPDVILGVYTPDELQEFRVPVDMGAADVVSPWQPELLAKATEAASRGSKGYATFWKALTPEQRDALFKTPEHEQFKEDALAADKRRTVDSQAAATKEDTPPTFPPADAVAAASPPPTSKSFDDVMQMLCTATTEDALYVAGDWIESITDKDQYNLLSAKFDERLANFRGEA